MGNLALISSYFGSFLWTVAAFLIVLTIVVFVHEMGHFLVARWCGVKVEAFSIGFGKEIAHRYDKHGTRWRLAWIPLGGYVKFAGDLNGASVPSHETLAAMSEEERKSSFHLKPLWQRASVVAAGPIANFLLAIVIFAGLFMIVGKVTHIARVDIVKPGSPAAIAGFQPGDIIRKINGSPISGLADLRMEEQFNGGTELTFEVERNGKRVKLVAAPKMTEVKVSIGGTAKVGVLGIDTILSRSQVGLVQKGSAADEAGLKTGDLITAINGQKVTRFSDLVKIVTPSAGKPLKVDYIRDGVKMSTTVVPKPVKVKDQSGIVHTVGRFGIGNYMDPQVWTHKRYGPFRALWMGTQESYLVITRTLKSVGDMFAGKQSASQLGGPFMIAEVSGQAASRGFAELMKLVAFLSVSIGLINLFPIPILDGGHLMFYAIEAIIGRPLGEKAQEIGFRIGLALVLMLMIFTTWNDVVRKISQLVGSG